MNSAEPAAHTPAGAPGSRRPACPDQIEQTGSATVRRRVTVQPAMCGPLYSLVAQAGDWTWGTVGELCGLDVLNASDVRGRRALLSFAYYRISCGGDLRPDLLGFGDRIEVHSHLFSARHRGLLTVHRIRRLGETESESESEEPDPLEFFARPRQDCMYIENLNFWVCRSREHSNVDLELSPPAGFTVRGLPDLAHRLLPFERCDKARSHGVIEDPETDDWPMSGSDLEIDHEVDITRDVNAVGLLSFSSYFGIAERARWQAWRAGGREARMSSEFAARRLTDATMCYLGNADPDAVLRLRVRTTRNPRDPAEERAEISLREVSTDRGLAVAAFRTRRDAGPEEAPASVDALHDELLEIAQ